MRTYAIGDIHGCLDQLKELMRLIWIDVASNKEDDIRIVFLGDYVDRGPDSKGVIDYLIGLQNMVKCGDIPHELLFLKGNHEELFEAKDDTWALNGGFNTAMSYGWDGVSPNIEEQIKIPQEHRDFVANLLPYYDDPVNKLFFVHAGIQPGLDIHEQDEYDMRWIRYDFLNHHGPYKMDRFVIHGHTPKRNSIPDWYSYRVNVDTGCVFDGYLCAAIFENDKAIGSLNVKGFNNNW